jgi:hypothetical protein
VPAPGEKSESSGTVAFDGRELVYTHLGETGNAPRQAVIHMLDPRTCSPLPDVQVSFTQADLTAWAVANGAGPSYQPDGGIDCRAVTHPTIEDLAYDDSRHVIWASIGNAEPAPDYPDNPYPYCANGPTTIGLFAITVAGDPASGAVGRASAAFLDNGCGRLLAYDRGQDRVWSCDRARGLIDPGAPSELDPASGYVIPSCAPSIADDGATTSAWTIAGDHVYVQLEDDSTLNVFDTRACTWVARYAHRGFIEPLAEDEQMACDGTTFAAGSAPLASGTQATVLWVRDAVSSTVSAYTIPEAGCSPHGTLTTQASPLVPPGVVLTPSTLSAPPPPPPVASAQAPQPAPAPATAPGAEPVGSFGAQFNAQVQAQSQSQAQAQSVSQLQPGMAVERQKRTQVATQQQAAGVNVAYQAGRLRTARATPLPALLAAVVVLGFGFVAKRSKWATARIRARRCDGRSDTS